MVFAKKDYHRIVEDILSELSERSPLTDSNVGSVSRTLVESIGREISILYGEMEAAYNAGFIDSARGSALDMVVAILGVQRKTAQYATGSVTFSRRKANHDVTILRGTRVSTVSSDLSRIKEFETSLSVVLPRGKNDIEVPVKAVVPGKEGMADFETITKLSSPIIGIDTIINKRPTSLGSERETDEELRARAKAMVLTAGKTTVESIRGSLLALPGVRGVAVKDMPEGVPGEIDVIVDGPDLSDVEDPMYEMVAGAIERVRPAGIRVNIRSTTMVRTDIEGFLSLTDSDRTDEEMEMALDSIREGISGYFASLGCGDGICRNRIVTAILNDGNVRNLEDVEIRTKVFDDRVRGLIDDTRKRIDERSRDVKVGEYERVELENVHIRTQFSPRVISRVLIDIKATVVPASRTLDESGIEAGIESQVLAHLERLKGGELIDYRRIFHLIRSTEGITELIDLTLSVLHEETGLTVMGARDDIGIGSNEYATLRDVSVKKAG